eukprot:scaffold213673_cov22-Tisochrysis_lutea.AAC.3
MNLQCASHWQEPIASWSDLDHLQTMTICTTHAPFHALQFKFDSVLQSASQEEVYQNVHLECLTQAPDCQIASHIAGCCGGRPQAAAADVLKSALDGYNGTIMAYGQTGSTQAQAGLIDPGQENKISISDACKLLHHSYQVLYALEGWLGLQRHGVSFSVPMDVMLPCFAAGAGKTYTMSGGRKQSFAQVSRPIKSSGHVHSSESVPQHNALDLQLCESQCPNLPAAKLLVYEKQEKHLHIN